MRYRRADVAGATYFVTVNLRDRKTDLLVRHFDLLRIVINDVKHRHAFRLEAMVVLPEHLHAIWTLPEGDSNFSLRWSLIKSAFSRRLPMLESISTSRQSQRERGIWQRRFWEHLVRDDNDFSRHVEYIHFNPVKHGLAKRATDWPYSTLHKFIDEGRLPVNWGGDADSNSPSSFGEL